MTLYIYITVSAFIISAICGFVFIPIILNFCKEKRLYDIPNYRKSHKNAIPRLGGISFIPSMLVAFIIALSLLCYKSNHNLTINLWSLYFLVGILLIYGIGIIDDLIGLPAMLKFIVQIIAACFMPLSGLYINNMYGFCGIWEIPLYIGCPITVLIIVFITNSINLIDGIDGLAGGIVIIALTGFGYLFALQGVWAYVILISGLIGVLVPYQYFNILGKVENNRKIFMGDSGSLTLGFILGFLFVKYSMNNPYVMPYRKDGLLLAYTLLIVPTFDVARVILIRLRNKKPIFGADKNHIHHKLMRTGMNQHQARISILAISILFIIINTTLYHLCYTNFIVLMDVIIYTGLHLVVDLILKKKMKSSDALKHYG
jgi:UDP-GlcNAc:undecaprenyl-phosphate/decaprenyl-phosphate GlcNAc-1-phosphate transferase